MIWKTNRPTELARSIQGFLRWDCVTSVYKYNSSRYEKKYTKHDFILLFRVLLVFPWRFEAVLNGIDTLVYSEAWKNPGVLPYRGYIGTCRGIGYGFWTFSILK